MIFELISLFDKKAEVYSPPSYYTHRAYMHRDLQKLLSSGNGAYALHPEDFQVFLIGVFDDRSGEISFPSDGRRFVSELSAFKPV